MKSAMLSTSWVKCAIPAALLFYLLVIALLLVLMTFVFRQRLRELTRDIS